MSRCQVNQQSTNSQPAWAKSATSSDQFGLVIRDGGLTTPTRIGDLYPFVDLTVRGRPMLKERWEVYEVDKAIPYHTPLCLMSLFSCSFHFFSSLSLILFVFDLVSVSFLLFLVSLYYCPFFFLPLIFLSSLSFYTSKTILSSLVHILPRKERANDGA